ncbi:MAG TPA: glycosyltransferase family 4 protein [Deltaproteobacteria bacterium]|nr:glycosyltransferase family 4 protein [Deltaproteobacteria bacterium]
MRIALVIPTLNGGGAERVMSNMANYWESKGNEVVIITHDSEKKDFYSLNPGVTRYGFDISKPPRHIWDTIKHNIQRITMPRKAIRTCRADIVISFTNRTNIQTLAGLIETKVPVIVSERNNPTAQPLPPLWNILRKLLYPMASAVVVQTEAVKEWAVEFLSADKVFVIPNPVSPPSIQESESELPSQLQRKKIVVAMGRLVHHKGFDLLIEAFSIAAGGRKDWSLMILGEGEDRTFLEDLARSLSIRDQIIMPGRVCNIGQIMKKSDLFVLSSRHEGFPNVLLEAMASGLPVISTDCPFGPSEIIHDGIDGMLVSNENIHEIALAMKHLMDDKKKRIRLGKEAKESSRRFSIEKIMNQWDHLISHTIENRLHHNRK